MNNFEALKKIFVNVPVNSCSTFRQLHITGATHDDKYWDKIVFLEDKCEIYTHGHLYSVSSEGQIGNLSHVLSEYLNAGSEGSSQYETVWSEIQSIISGLNSSDTMNISYVTGEGYKLEDTLSLTHGEDWVALGGGTSYGTTLGNKIDIADTAADIEDTNTSYLITTSSAVRDYVNGRISTLSATTVESTTPLYIGIENTSSESSALSYEVTANIVPIDKARDYLYNEETHEWVHSEGNVNNGLADVADIAKHITDIEEVVAEALVELDARIDNISGGEYFAERIAAIEEALRTLGVWKEYPPIIEQN